MNLLSFLNGCFYVNGSMVTAATYWEVAQNEQAKLEAENEALRSENSNLKAHIKTIEG